MKHPDSNIFSELLWALTLAGVIGFAFFCYQKWSGLISLDLKQGMRNWEEALLEEQGDEIVKPIFFKPFLISRAVYAKLHFGWLPSWLVIWALPLFLAAIGFFLQNLQLHVGTYYYVHKMVQYDLKVKHTVDPSSLQWASFGLTDKNVSFGSLEDPVAGALSSESVPIGFLDELAILFPFLFLTVTLLTDNPYSWTKVWVAFFFLSTFKGLFGWMTIVPDSNGWEVCKERLAPAGDYNIDWYKKEHTFLQLLIMFVTHPTSRMCADMMYSGHTYFVTLFALGLFEETRMHCFALQVTPWKRIAIESLVAAAAFTQQAVEIYFVLKSRFHYTSDVVMALLVTYLMFTNSTIATLASWWTWFPKQEWDLLTTATGDKTWKTNRWLHALKPSGYLSLGCCCCTWSQQWLYGHADMVALTKTVEDSRKPPQEVLRDDKVGMSKADHDEAFKMTDKIRKLHMAVVLHTELDD